MCLTIPGKIIEINKENKAIIEFPGKKQEADSQLIKNIKKGDYVFVNNGFIVKKISKQEAKEIFNAININ